MSSRHLLHNCCHQYKVETDELTNLESREVNFVRKMANWQSVEECKNLPKFAKSMHSDHRMNGGI